MNNLNSILLEGNPGAAHSYGSWCAACAAARARVVA
jgi:hypothetical protein